MKKNLVIALVAIVAVVGIFVFLQQQKNTGSEVGVIPQGNEQPPQQQGGGMQSLRDLLALGTSQKCTFLSDVDGQQSEGVVYVSGGKVRGDFASRVSANGSLVMSHMIIEGNTMKMWQDGESMGMVMSVPQGGDVPQQTGEKSLSYDEKVDYSCSPWIVDGSVFVAPTNVMFHSMDEMMQMGAPQGGGAAGDAGMMEGMEPMNMDMGAAAGGVELRERQCRLCEDVTGAEAKAQCKAAFQCE